MSFSNAGDHAISAARGCASATVDSQRPLPDSVLIVRPARRRPSEEPRAADRPPPRGLLTTAFARAARRVVISEVACAASAVASVRGRD